MQTERFHQLIAIIITDIIFAEAAAQCEGL